MCGSSESGRGDSNHHGDGHHEHGHILVPEEYLTRRRFISAGTLGIGAVLLAACGRSPDPLAESLTSDGAASVQSSTSVVVPTSTTAAPMGSLAPATTAAPGTGTPAVLAGFDEFAATVSVVREGKWWLVESNGLPAHNMMVGITSWQQQVPVAQPYTGSNRWKIPVTPVLSDEPVSARTALYRGAIALAANGVPIFNALNNRGDDAFLFGELDEWGGHAGRADDYHYHVAPLHLSAVLGEGTPIAYALDGFPVYGEKEPDGSAVGKLDEYNGHFSADGSYHYHGTRTYPYVNGGLRGVVTVAGDQVEPQPRTNPFRPSLEPLRGATITSFSSPSSGSYVLGYSVAGGAGEVAYTVTAREVRFTFTVPDGSVTRETYARR
jgi:hypothetical protein